MNLKQTLLGFGALLILGSCSSTNDAISKGPIQKRKLRSGWYVNLNTGNRHQMAKLPEHQEKRTRDTALPEAPAQHALPVPESPMASAEPTTAKVIQASRVGIHERPTADLTASVDGLALESGKPAIADQPARNEAAIAAAPDGGEGTGTNDKMNGMALAGFICSFFIPILGLIFSAVALGQIRRRGGRGHGLAVAGLIISIATMLLVIALL